MRPAVIPISILPGFLGSGKTTILRYLLRQPGFSRTAVIINEFGEVGLDHELVEPSEDSFIELKTGCLCCKIRTDLAQTVQDLLRRRDAGNCSPFDRIVIETSGLADPAPILQTLMTDRTIAGRWARRAGRGGYDCGYGDRRHHARAGRYFTKAGRRRRQNCADQIGSQQACPARAAPPPDGAQRCRTSAERRSRQN